MKWVSFAFMAIGAGASMATSAASGELERASTYDSATYKYWVAKMPHYADVLTDSHSYNLCLSRLSSLGSASKDRVVKTANCSHMPEHHYSGFLRCGRHRRSGEPT